MRLRGTLVTADAVVDDGVVDIDGDRIVSVAPAVECAGPLPDPVGIVYPGLVDIHNHGGGGHSFTTTAADAAAAAAAHHHRHGTTTLLASLVTAPADELLAQLDTLRPLVAPGTIAGIHLEGPFLSHARCGAQDPRYLLDPDPELTHRLLAGGDVRMMTVAPELPGVTDVTRILDQHGVTIALGHSDSDFDTFRAALAADRVVTHLANGMPPLHHRSSGPVAAALSGPAVLEVIGDGVHVDPGFVALAFAAAPARVALITDAMAAAGMPDGTYQLGPQAVTVVDGVARIAVATAPGLGSIAGGTGHLVEIVARAVHASQVPLVDAVRAASLTPARAVGLDTDCGALQPGAYADAVVVDDRLRLRRVLRRGRWLT